MATQNRRSQRIGSVLGGTFTLLGLTGLIGGLSRAVCLPDVFFEIPLRTVLDALTPVILATWQLGLPCLFGHTGLLESLLQVSVCGWRLFLTFACGA